MRRLLLLFAALLFASAAFSLETEEVILYPDGATVISKAVMYLEPGKNFVGFLPRDVDRASLSVAANCDVAMITGADLGNPRKTPAYKDLEKRLRKLKDEIESLSFSLNFYRKAAESLAAGFGTRTTLSQIERGFEAVSAKISGIRNRIQELEKRKKELERRLRDMGNWMALYVWSTAQDECELTVSYNTRSARWSPEYVIDYSNGTMMLYFKARLWQGTLMDWKGVSVKLSSSQPTRSLEVPHPKPWFLYVVEKKPRVLAMAPGASRKAPPREPSREFERRLTGFSFELPGRIDLPSGREELFTINAFRWKRVKVERLCVPFDSEKVYMMARVKAPSVPLPDGTVKVLEERFLVGEVRLKEIRDENTLKVPLGVDQEIQVEAKIDEFRVEKRWNGDREVTVGCRIKLFNTKDKKVNVKLYFPLPVSKDDRIDVSILKDKFTLKPDRVEKNGIALWNLSLAPGKREVVYVGFKVRYPGNTEINLF